jgi:hypothetical protein
MQENNIRVKTKKPRNNLVEDMYDGNSFPRRETPKVQYQRKEKYNNWLYQTEDELDDDEGWDG